jgi:2-hydroxy-3-keto-5-methylthiopentenyl-1-phosphate phosphatase
MVMLVVLDFDGTLADADTLDLLAERYAPEAFAAADAAFERGALTLDETISAQFRPVTAPLDELLGVLRREVSPRPGAQELVAFCRERFLDVVIVSAGFVELIEPFLAWNQLRLAVVANHAEFGSGGVTVRFRYRPFCEVCGERCKRGDVRRLANASRVAYVGDGASDLCAAKAAGLVFARDRLARRLSDEGVAFTPFSDCYDVRAGLAAFLSPA